MAKKIECGTNLQQEETYRSKKAKTSGGFAMTEWRLKKWVEFKRHF